MQVLLTGGSRGIGEAIKNTFNSSEFNIISPSRQELDLTNVGHVKEYIETLPDIDIIINNAGVNNLKNIDLESYDSIIETFNVNYLSPFFICKHFLPKMKFKNYGRILNIGSIWIDFSKEKRGSYSASKNALHSLTKSIVAEYGQYNILCNTISPGFILTDLTVKNNSEEDLKNILKQIPQNRLGNVNEIADLVYFLTVKNTYINGQNIRIDGGYSCTAKN